MASVDTTTATEIVSPPATETVSPPATNSVNDTQIVDGADVSTPKRAKLDEGESSPSKKTRSASKNKGSDAVMMAEAKAAFGDLDTSEGRRLRKRSSEPAKVEEKKPIPRRSSSKRKGSTKAAQPEEEEEEEEEVVDDMHTAEKNGSGEKPENDSAKTDGVADNKSKEENSKSTVDKSGKDDDGVETKTNDDEEKKSVDAKKSEESKDERPAAAGGDTDAPCGEKSKSD